MQPACLRAQPWGATSTRTDARGAPAAPRWSPRLGVQPPEGGTTSGGSSVHRSTRLVAGLATAALVSGGALVAAQPSEAAAGAAAVKRPVDCPTAYPVG